MRCWKNRNWITSILVIEDHFCMFIPTHYICFLSMKYRQQWTIVVSNLGQTFIFGMILRWDCVAHFTYNHARIIDFVSHIFNNFRRSVTDFRKMRKLFYALLFSLKCFIKFNILSWLIKKNKKYRMWVKQ